MSSWGQPPAICRASTTRGASTITQQFVTDVLIDSALHNGEHAIFQAPHRRNLVIDAMLARGTITQEEHDDAIATELGLTGTPTLDGCTGSAQGAYLCAYATHLILDDTAYRATVEDRQEVLYRSDLTIRTTLDRREQAAAQAVMNDTADKASR